MRSLLRSAGGADADIDAAAEASGGLGLFVRSLVGPDRVTAQEAFARFLDGTRFSVAQVRFAKHFVTELTKHGVVDVGRLYEPA